MKKTLPFILVFIAAISLAATHDFFLLPENFFMHKGDKLNLHLIAGDVFTKQDEMKYEPGKTVKFMLFYGSKKVDLTKIAKESESPVLNYTMTNSGQALLEMTRGYEFKESSRDSYSEALTSQGYDKLAETVKNSSQFRVKEKYTRYLKTLVFVDDHDGNDFEKVLNDDYEIILKDNPYKKKYGDDMIALLMFKGKPAKGAAMQLYIKSLSGNVYTQNLITDNKGLVSFTMSREGIFMLRSVRIEATKDKDADYESWWASYTFPFSSSDDVPNTYREFGFGDKH